MKNRRIWIACFVVAAPTSLVAGQTLAEISSDKRVTISGVVDRITSEDTFILKDHTGRIPVYLGPNRVAVEEGLPVTVHGLVDDDVPREIYADRMRIGDGPQLELDHRYD